MALITNHTFGKLCSRVEINKEIDLATFIQFIYDDERLYYVLNKLEIKYLFNYRNLLNDEDTFMVEFYNEVPERIDKKQFVFEKAGKLKYHTFSNCSSLNKDFIDFHIPVEIREKGELAVNDYRTWFKEKRIADDFFNGKLDQEKMIFAYNMRFPPKYSIPPLNEQFKLIEKRANSNHSKIKESFDLNSFKNQLEQQLEYYYMIFTCPVLKTLSKHKYLYDKSNEEIEGKLSTLFSPEFVTNYGINAVRSKLKYAKEIVNSIMQLLVDYFKWNFKIHSKEFNVINLEKFGLECCGYCKMEMAIT